MPSQLQIDILNQLSELASNFSDRVENEAETRHKVIDFVLHEVLSWPKNRVTVEEYIKPGFADYVLKRNNDDDLIFIEAKKSGVYFALPKPHKKGETSTYIGIQKLLSDENIRSAMTQVRTYCIDSGCEFACITNGHEWIFFKTFEKGKRWEASQAFVVRSLDFFIKEYTLAVNNLGYTSIIEGSSLTTLLTSTPPKDRNIYYAKEKIKSYSHSINANRLASMLRPVVSHYFGVISDDCPAPYN
jgi:predicted type IV restriction endonuclease